MAVHAGCAVCMQPTWQRMQACTMRACVRPDAMETMHRTRAPSLAAKYAAVSPAAPPPMTATSTVPSATPPPPRAWPARADGRREASAMCARLADSCSCDS
eukprot:366537-Chlamydomonas_euryale.AAC.14